MEEKKQKQRKTSKPPSHSRSSVTPTSTRTISWHKMIDMWPADVIRMICYVLHSHVDLVSLSMTNKRMYGLVWAGLEDEKNKHGKELVRLFSRPYMKISKLEAILTANKPFEMTVSRGLNGHLYGRWGMWASLPTSTINHHIVEILFGHLTKLLTFFSERKEEQRAMTANFLSSINTKEDQQAAFGEEVGDIPDEVVVSNAKQQLKLFKIFTTEGYMIRQGKIHHSQEQGTWITYKRPEQYSLYGYVSAWKLNQVCWPGSEAYLNPTIDEEAVWAYQQSWPFGDWEPNQIKFVQEYHDGMEQGVQCHHWYTTWSIPVQNGLRHGVACVSDSGATFHKGKQIEGLRYHTILFPSASSQYQYDDAGDLSFVIREKWDSCSPDFTHIRIEEEQYKCNKDGTITAQLRRWRVTGELESIADNNEEITYDITGNIEERRRFATEEEVGTQKKYNKDGTIKSTKKFERSTPWGLGTWNDYFPTPLDEPCVYYNTYDDIHDDIFPTNAINMEQWVDGSLTEPEE